MKGVVLDNTEVKGAGFEGKLSNGYAMRPNGGGGDIEFKNAIAEGNTFDGFALVGGLKSAKFTDTVSQRNGGDGYDSDAAATQLLSVSSLGNGAVVVRDDPTELRDQGRGIVVAKSGTQTVLVENGLVLDNRKVGLQGNLSTNVKVYASTFADNDKTDGQQIVSKGLTVRNTIAKGTVFVAGDSSPSCSNNVYTGDNGGCRGSIVTEDTIFADTTRTLLNPLSKAVDGGAKISELSLADTKDRAGNARPQDGDGNGTAQYDIGAYELPPPLTPLATATRTGVPTPPTPTAGRTTRPTSTPLPTNTLTNTRPPASTFTPTKTWTFTPTRTPTPTPPFCFGDCDGDYTVEAEDIGRMISLALGRGTCQRDYPASTISGTFMASARANDLVTAVGNLNATARSCRFAAPLNTPQSGTPTPGIDPRLVWMPMFAFYQDTSPPQVHFSIWAENRSPAVGLGALTYSFNYPNSLPTPVCTPARDVLTHTDTQRLPNDQRRTNIVVANQARYPAPTISSGMRVECYSVFPTCPASATCTPIPPSSFEVDIRRSASDPLGNALPIAAATPVILELGSRPDGCDCAINPRQSPIENLGAFLLPPIALLWMRRRKRLPAAHVGCLALLILAFNGDAVEAQSLPGGALGGWRKTEVNRRMRSGASAAPQKWAITDISLQNGVLRGSVGIDGASFFVVGTFVAPEPGADWHTEGELHDQDGVLRAYVTADVTADGVGGTYDAENGETGEWWWEGPTDGSWALAYQALAARRSPTPTDPPGAATHTPTLTPTPRSTRTPTFTPAPDDSTPMPTWTPPICVIEEIAPLQVAHLGFSGPDYPTSESNSVTCSSDPEHVVVQRDRQSCLSCAPHYVVGDTFLRWDTSAFEGKIILDAKLRMTLDGLSGPNPTLEYPNRTIQGHWVTWDGSCPSSYSEDPNEALGLNQNSNDALTDCGEPCGVYFLEQESIGNPVTFPLSNFEPHVGLGASTSLRLRLSGHAPGTGPSAPLGANAVRFLGAADPEVGPVLILNVCDEAVLTPTPTITWTATPTDTPVDTPTPFPAATPGMCRQSWFSPIQLAALHGSSASYPPAGGQCSAQSYPATIESSFEQDEFERTDLLIQWNTASLPGDAVILSADLSLSFGMIENEDDGAIVGHWQDWDGVCDGDSYTDPAGDDAFALCGNGCTLGALSPASSTWMALSGAAEHIDAFGNATLRLGISGAAPSGTNSIGLGPPELMVTWCDPAAWPFFTNPATTPNQSPSSTPTPTPTPDPDCDYFDLPAADEYMATSFVRGETSVHAGCVDDYDDGTLLAANMAVGAANLVSSLILHFDTSELPSGMRPVEARLRLHPISVGIAPSENAQGIWGEWIDPTDGFCGESDFGPALGGALATSGPCGEACSLPNMIAGAANDLRLSNAPNHVTAEGTAIRLRLPSGDSDIGNYLKVARSNTGDGPRLVVLACEQPPEPILPGVEGCEWHHLPADETWSVHAEGTWLNDAVGARCSDDDGDQSLLLHQDYRYDSEEGAQLDVTNLLLSFDTSGLPADKVASFAALRLPILDATTADPRVEAGNHSLAGEWFPGESCDPSEYSSMGEGNALSLEDEECGEECNLGRMHPGSDQYLPLSNPMTLSFGEPRLRLHLNAGDDASLRVTNAAHDRAPEVIALSCAVPPTPAIAAPQEGCENRLIQTVTSGWDAISWEGEPAYCTQSLLPSSVGLRVLGAGVELGPDPESPPTFDARMLLRWPTEDLPQGKVVNAAWLRFYVGATWANDAGARLTADWYEWGPSCSSDDVAAVASGDALANCGTACELGGMTPSSYVDLPLSGAAAHVARGEGANTELRVGVGVTQMSTYNLFLAPVSAILFHGPGLVLQLCPEATPTQTPDPTVTPTP